MKGGFEWRKKIKLGSVHEVDELNSRGQRPRVRSNLSIATLKGSNRREAPMAQTLVCLLVHVIFSTKNREPLITRDIEPELFAYIGRNNESRLLDAGGTLDHVHLLISQSKNIALSLAYRQSDLHNQPTVFRVRGLDRSVMQVHRAGGD